MSLNIIKSSILGSVVLPKIGRVHLRGIVGKPVKADLVKLHSLLNRSMIGSVPIVQIFQLLVFLRLP